MWYMSSQLNVVSIEFNLSRLCSKSDPELVQKVLSFDSPLNYWWDNCELLNDPGISGQKITTGSHCNLVSYVQNTYNTHAIAPISWWWHDVETFYTLASLLCRNTLVDTTYKGPVIWRFNVNCCTNSQVATDLRHHDAHVTSWGGCSIRADSRPVNERRRYQVTQSLIGWA